jgi:TolB-like protein/Flp pilus assembly protein TadD
MPSIAVLPFTSLGGTARRQLFADGIAEEIITTLSRLSSFFVISRNSSFTYRDRALDVRQLAQEFGVRYVLEGAVRWGGKRIRVTAQLTDAEAGNNIWADRYDRDFSDFLGVQEEISQVVVDALGPAISEAERKRAMARAPESLGAWEAYQRALWHWSRLDAGSPANVRRFLEKAVTLDERFAQAHAMLAYMHLSDFTRGLHQQPHASLQLAEDEARTAISLDPDNPGGHATLAWTFTHRGRMGPAKEEADLAVMLGPSDPWAQVSRGHVLAFSGNSAEALGVLATVLRLDPFGPTTPVALHHLGVSYYFQRDYTAAEAMARRTISSFPHFPRPYSILAAALGQLGRHDEAQTALATAISISPDYLSNVTGGQMAYYRPEDFEHVLEGLRRAGWGAPDTN